MVGVIAPLQQESINAFQVSIRGFEYCNSYLEQKLCAPLCKWTMHYSVRENGVVNVRDIPVTCCNNLPGTGAAISLPVCLTAVHDTVLVLYNFAGTSGTSIKWKKNS